MIENKLYNIFFALLRSGLWNRSPAKELFPINDNLWGEVYWLACRQTVEGIIYDGIMQLSEESLPPRDLLIKWTARIDIIERRNMHMDKVVAELAGLFAANGISFCLLKGQGIAGCYIKPFHHICGDIDWYFPSYSDFSKARQLIVDRGVLTHYTDFSDSYVWRGLPIDHHSRMFDLFNPFLCSYLKRLQRSEKPLSLSLLLEEHEVVLPSPLLTHIQVNSHILKHMLMFGIGLRQLCDSARVCYTYRDIDKAALKETYCKAGIYRWMLVLNSLLVEYLGMPPECLPFPLPDVPQDTQWMIEEMICSGNFGFYDRRWGNNDKGMYIKRNKRLLQVFHRLSLLVRYVPLESFWFPVMLVYSRIKNINCKYGV
jgi:hypothetical protein